MQAVILAAGRGKRMGKLTQSTTKPMLKLKGKPILEHKIKALPKKIKEIVFVVGYHSMHIISHFKRHYAGRRITYVFQSDLNGTGGALHLAKSILRDKFLVMMGDDLYCKKDLNNLLRHEMAILGFESEDAGRFGSISMDKKNNLKNVLEASSKKKSRGGMINVGVYVINKKFFEYDLVPIGKGEFGLPQTLSAMAKDHKIRVEKASLWHPIGHPEDLKTAEKILNKFL